MSNNSEPQNMKLNLKIWRQKDGKSRGEIVDYSMDNVSPDMSFLEMLDVLNEKLVVENKEPVAFDHRTHQRGGHCHDDNQGPVPGAGHYLLLDRHAGI